METAKLVKTCFTITINSTNKSEKFSANSFAKWQKTKKGLRIGDEELWN